MRINRPGIVLAWELEEKLSLSLVDQLPSRTSTDKEEKY